MNDCGICHDTGATERHERSRRTLQDGTVIESSALLTDPCVCRRGLPPRDGKATWWSLEPVFSRTVMVGCDEVTVSVAAEVPMDAENYRVHRRGNRYYPTTIDVEPETWPSVMHPDQTRELAQALIDAAAICEAIDKPDADTCGHWFPCSCAVPSPQEPKEP